MVDVGSRNLHRNLFKELDPLLLLCQYIFSFIIFVVEHLENFRTNSWINGLEIRNATHLHRLVSNLSFFQQVVSYAGI